MEYADKSNFYHNMMSKREVGRKMQKVGRRK